MTVDKVTNTRFILLYLYESRWGLSEEGMKGLVSIILKKQWKIREMRMSTRDCYLQVLTGAEDINFLQNATADDFDSDSEISDDEL